MIVIELSEDKFGQAMKDISCMEECLSELKECLENESMGLRRYYPKYPYEDEYYGNRRKSKDSKEYNRYM